MSNLRTLEQHETEATVRHRERQRAMGLDVPNGIACPKCQAELVDRYGGSTMLSRPPRKSIRCLACGWQGTRIA